MSEDLTSNQEESRLPICIDNRGDPIIIYQGSNQVIFLYNNLYYDVMIGYNMASVLCGTEFVDSNVYNLKFWPNGGADLRFRLSRDWTLSEIADDPLGFLISETML